MDNSRREVLSQFEAGADEIDRRLDDALATARTGGFSVRVTLDGREVPGAEVSLEQDRHDFLHGANIFMLDELDTERQNAEYKRYFKEAFNLATIPFYWRDLEPEQGKPRFAADSPKVYRRPAPDLCLDFCEANGITPKEHCLTYDYWMPQWVPTDDVPRIKALYTERYRQLAQRYAGRIHGWEVINETLFTKGDTAFYYADDYIE